MRFALIINEKCDKMHIDLHAEEVFLLENELRHNSTKTTFYVSRKCRKKRLIDLSESLILEAAI
ncbi:hypothetical protein DQG23_40900 [Paenibacillus contaminans]|uniref:Uncharacterized protein n=1 Tax=Paenibacillus contaminans TaxID=450362 RepID=A0A329LMN9_9BACL|nr:hypothetical protein DQG23_40900 [Paenibacillus contaminans]